MPFTPLTVAPAEEQSAVGTFFCRNKDGDGFPTELSHFDTTPPGVPAGYPGPQSPSAPTKVHGVIEKLGNAFAAPPDNAKTVGSIKATRLIVIIDNFVLACLIPA